MIGLLASFLLVTGPPSAFDHGLAGGGPRSISHGDCVTPHERALVRAASDARRAVTGRSEEGTSITPAFTFYPMAGQHGLDVFTGGFVDVDPVRNQFTNFACLPFTYDGHTGIDTSLRSFGEQVVGVPVFAVMDGVVIFAQDGWPDMNTNGGVQGNIIGIDHGDGLDTWYYHLKNGSVLVNMDDVVVAGQQIGSVASSGNSFGPHLHFETHIDGDPYEPFAGACRPGPSGWTDQPPIILETHLQDFGFTHIDLKTVPGLPHELPRAGQLALDDQVMTFWLLGHNLPPDSEWRVRILRPDGTEAVLSEWFFFNTETYRDYWFWWEYDVPDMHTTTGTWRVIVEFNDQVMADAPIEVRVERTPDFNRPPEPVTVAFEPASPTPDDIVRCVVDSDPVVDDVDYDILRYHYVWTVDDVVVRDVTTAATSDVIPVGSAPTGGVLACTVTVSDAMLSAPDASVSVVVMNDPDITGDGEVGVNDLLALLSAWGPCVACPEDLDGDGIVGVQDLLILLSAWG